jgi:D-amino peptidase
MTTNIARIIFSIVLLIFLSSDPCVAQKLKVFISVDMEGITGVVHGEQTGTGPEYNMARKWMAEDVNAAILGALDAGATEIIVNDSHGSMRNILPTDLHPAAFLISGSPKPLGMMQGIDSTVDAAMFIGYHAKAGTVNAILDHTISGSAVFSIKINGMEMPELGINALIGGYFNVPVVLVAGDKAVCDQTNEVLGNKVVTAPVKEAIGRYAAKNLSLEKAHQLIRQQAKAALERRKEIQSFKLRGPYQIELTCHTSSQADNAAIVPGVKRLNPRTLQIESNDVLSVIKLLRLLITLGGAG